MQQLHRLGRAHNDLKPDNLMVCNWQELKKVQLVIVDIAGSIVQGTCQAAAAVCLSVSVCQCQASRSMPSFVSVQKFDDAGSR